MNFVFDPFNIVIIAVAVIVLLRLRSVLGTRTGNEKQYDPYSRTDTAPAKSPGTGKDNVVHLPGHGPGDENVEDKDGERPPVWQGIADENSELAKGLLAIAEKDPAFDANAFITGAKAAYEMVVTGFAEGNKKTLKDLLSKDVYRGFASAIDERKVNGESMQLQFIGIDKASLLEAGVHNNQARLTLKFASEMITATFDADGEVIDGDPGQVAKVNDVWTFERSLRSKNPNWKLVETQEVN